MKSRVASARAIDGLDRVDCAVQLLEEEWRRHGDVPLERFWGKERGALAGDAQSELAMLVALIKADLRRRFDRGEKPTVQSYLERFPELRATDDRVVSLVYEEFCLSEERGHSPRVESYCERYPDWQSSLVSQLQYHRLLSEAAGVKRPALPVFPNPGDAFEHFRLVTQLGVGGTSRVFLAGDASLGGKRVVLKVTQRCQEPKVLGSLDHPHIVPVNSVTDQGSGSLCGLSMPFYAGLPLDLIIARLQPASRPRKALAIWQALVDRYAEVPKDQIVDGFDLYGHRKLGPRGDGWEDFPVRGSYAQGVAWLGMILARALQYAHTRQTFHRDVKPANLLITFTHGPQLLDFNLAESPHTADHAHTALHGGTVPYMAPEQIEAFTNPDLWSKVGAQADIYSLGLVLRELLTGVAPEAPNRDLPLSRALRGLLDRRRTLNVRLRRANPSVPHALEAIVAKCMAFDRRHRHHDAKELADDLEAFLKRAPLPHAYNPSRRERLANWSVRHRRSLAEACCVVLVGAALLRPIAESLKPRVETLASFQEATSALDTKDYVSAQKNLLALEKDYPQSSLVKLYSSRIINQIGRDKIKADQILRDALNVPDAKSSLIAWAQTHEELTDYLLQFAAARIERIDKVAAMIDANRDVGNLADDQADNSFGDGENGERDLGESPDQRDLECRKPMYELAHDILRALESITSTCPAQRKHLPKVERLLARTEDVYGEYESAFNRITRMLGSLDDGDRSAQDDRFHFRALRGGVVIGWIRKMRKENRPIDDAMLDNLKLAIEDLAFSRVHLENTRFSREPEETKLFFVTRDEARVALVLAEGEIDRQMLSDASKHLKKVRSRIGELKALTGIINKQNEGKPGFTKVEPPNGLAQQLKKAQERLRALQASQSGMVPSGSNQNGTQPASDHHGNAAIQGEVKINSVAALRQPAR
jgi:serine/threonine protein kinase